MTDLIEPGPAEPKSGAEQRPNRPAAPSASGEHPQHRPVDRRQQQRWVPRLAGWIVLLLGVAFIAIGVNSGLFEHLHHVMQHLHHVRIRLHGEPPTKIAKGAAKAAEAGALSVTYAVTRTASIVIGLLLLMLCHGLFRRKHRSWQ